MKKQQNSQLTDLKNHGKRLVLPVVGGGLVYVLSGAVVFALAVFGGIFAFQWWRKKGHK